jgi:hypothetical protein
MPTLRGDLAEVSFGAIMKTLKFPYPYSHFISSR